MYETKFASIKVIDDNPKHYEDRDIGRVRAKAVMRAGDVAAMPADIRHQGYSRKRSMLLVWENADSTVPESITTGRHRPTRPSSSRPAEDKALGVVDQLLQTSQPGLPIPRGRPVGHRTGDGL